MNNPSPLVPQGSLLEEKAKRKPHLRIAVLIVLAHVVVIGGLLMQGCKKEAKNDPLTSSLTETNDAGLPPVDTNYYSSFDTNIAATASNNAYYGAAPTNTAIGTSNSYATTPTSTSNTYAPATNYDTYATTPAYGTSTTPTTSGFGASTTEHVIVSGDSFYKIAKQYGVSVKAITEANPGVNASKLQLGKKLVIPAGGTGATVTGGLSATTTSSTVPTTSSSSTTTYVVKGGDSLTKIAKNNGTTIKAIKAANNMKTDRINVGQKLKIPSTAAAAPAPTPAAPVTPEYVTPLPTTTNGGTTRL